MDGRDLRPAVTVNRVLKTGGRAMSIELETKGPVVSLPAREIPLPAALSDAAKAVLTAAGRPSDVMPALDDHDAWRKLISDRSTGAAQTQAPLLERLKADVEATEMAGVPVYIGRPRGERLIDERHVVFDIH